MKSLPVRADRRRGFTLLELLIVMVVIGLLMGLLLPAVFRVNTGIRRRRADVAATAVRTAIETYHSRYRRWPAPGSDLDDNVDYVYGDPNGPRPNNNVVVQLLLDPAGDGSERALLDLKHFRTEVADPIGGRPSVNLLDPWWNREEDAQYRIQMDLNYDGDLVDPADNRRYRQRVRVWSVNS